MHYKYTDDISITVFLKNDPKSPNYIRIELSRGLDAFLVQLDADFQAIENGMIDGANKMNFGC